VKSCAASIRFTPPSTTWSKSASPRTSISVRASNRGVAAVLASILASVTPAVGCGGRQAHLDYQAHRGGRALRPENTLDSFAHALELDVDTLEMDVMLTADDVLVVHHDERLNPDITRDASGAWLAATGPALRSLPLAELERYDVGRIKPGTAYAARFPDQVGRDGVRIPTLAQVIALAEQRSRGRIHYNIEIKTTPSKPDDTAPPAVVAEKLVALVRSTGISARTTIQSFDWRSLARVHELAPELPRSCLTDAETVAPAWNAGLDVKAHGGSVPQLVHAFGCTIWSPDHEPLTVDQVSEAHRLGLAVVPWTVNAPDAMAGLIGWHIDGIISDAPDRLPRRKR
jgi:glycerophosphoryl diester phosphodiesterase